MKLEKHMSALGHHTCLFLTRRYLKFLPVMLNFLGLCFEVITLRVELMFLIRVIGLSGTYVPGTANSKSLHFKSFGDTYWRSKEVNCK